MEREGRDGRIERIQADPIAMTELATFAKAFKKADWDVLAEWKEEDETIGPSPSEMDYFDCLTHLVDELDLWPPEAPPTVDDLIVDLQRRGKLGMASRRAYAAMELAKQHADAKAAIPYLKPLLTDMDFRVRVWAHCALGRIVPSERELHRKSICAIREACVEGSYAVMLGDGKTGPSPVHKVVCSLVLGFAENALKVLDEPSQ